jgi:hypothetical protein
MKKTPYLLRRFFFFKYPCYTLKMTAGRLLEQNGDFTNSPLIQTVRKLHRLFSFRRMDYAVVGGMAVVRNGNRCVLQEAGGRRN